MSALDSIAVRAEPLTGNVEPLLHEIRHAVERLLERGEPTSIDIKTIPIAPAELDALETALGRGEIEAELKVLGRSAIRETGMAGVWIVEHFNIDDELMAKQIEITHVPEILRSQRSDIAAGLQQLERRLGESQPVAREGGGGEPPIG